MKASALNLALCIHVQDSYFEGKKEVVLEQLAKGAQLQRY